MNRISIALREFLKEETLEIFNNQQHQFASLSDDEEIIVVINECGEENLYLQTGTEQAILAFGEWRKIYDDTLEEIDALKYDIEQILTNQSYVWTIIDAPNCIVGYVSDQGIQYFTDTNEFGWNYQSSNEFFKTIAKDEGSQNFLFWHPGHQVIEPSQFLM